MTDYSELKRLAEGATPGEWRVDDPWIVYARIDGQIIYLANTEKLDVRQPQSYKNAEFIAAANPSTVLALIHDLDVASSVGRALGITLGNVAEARDALVTVVASLKAEIEQLHNMTGTAMGVGSGAGSLFVYGDYDSIKAAQAIVIERDQLKAVIEIHNKIIAERNRLLDAIPACPVHGQCVPHAIEWVEKALLVMRELKAENERLKSVHESGRQHAMALAAQNEALRKWTTRYEWLRKGDNEKDAQDQSWSWDQIDAAIERSRCP